MFQPNRLEKKSRWRVGSDDWISQCTTAGCSRFLGAGLAAALVAGLAAARAGIRADLHAALLALRFGALRFTTLLTTFFAGACFLRADFLAAMANPPSAPLISGACPPRGGRTPAPPVMSRRPGEK